MEDTNLLL